MVQLCEVHVKWNERGVQKEQVEILLYAEKGQKCVEGGRHTWHRSYSSAERQMTFDSRKETLNQSKDVSIQKNLKDYGNRKQDIYINGKE